MDYKERAEQLEAENVELKKKVDELQDEVAFLKKFDKIYSTAIGLTSNTVTFVDIEKKSLNQIVNEGDYFGIASSMENAPESIIETGIIYPDDCEEYRRFYRDIYAGKPTAEATMRVAEENRGWVWFTMYGKTLYKEDGTPEMSVVFSDDITARKRAEMQYMEYKEMVTGDADMVWEANLSKDQMIEEADETGEFFAKNNFKKYSKIAETAFDQIPEEYREAVKQMFSVEGLKEAYHNAKREVSMEYTFKNAGTNEIVWLKSTGYLLTNYEGDICVIVCSKDVTEKKKKETELRKMAQRDALSGLYNRRTFEEKVKSDMASCKGTTPQFLIIDVDDFKQINDKYGHASGDRVIVKIADLLLKYFSKDALIARIGGDEFMMYIYDRLSDDVFMEKVNLLNQSLKDLNTDTGEKMDVHLSMGSVVRKSDETFDELYKCADAALYKAKRNGKHNIVAYEDMES